MFNNTQPYVGQNYQFPERQKVITSADLSEFKQQSDNDRRDNIYNKAIHTSDIKYWSDLICMVVENPARGRSAYDMCTFTFNIMKNLRPSAFSCSLGNDILRMIKKSGSMDVLALILKEFFTNREIGFQAKENLTKNCSTIDEKINEIISRGNIDASFYTNILEMYLQIRYANVSEEEFNKLDFDSLGEAKEKIKDLYIYVLKPLGKFLESLENLSEIFVKWLVLIEGRGEGDYAICVDISDLIAQSCRLSTFRAFFSGDFDFKKMLKVFRTMFMCLRIENLHDSLLRTNLNLFLIFEAFPEDVIRKFTADKFSEILQEFKSPEDAVVIFVNLFSIAVTVKMLNFFEIITRMLFGIKNFSYLAPLYLEVIMKLFPKKLKSPHMFPKVYEIIKFYVLGFSKIISPSPSFFLSIFEVIEHTHYKNGSKQKMNDLITFAESLILINDLDKNANFDQVIENLKNTRARFDLSSTSKEIITALSSNIWPLNEKEKIEILKKKEILRRGGSVFTMNSKFRGLTNLGNNITSMDYSKLLSYKDTLLYELHALFDNLKKSANLEIKPEKFKERLPEPFRSTKAQQDSSEFGRLLLDGLANDFKLFPEPGVYSF